MTPQEQSVIPAGLELAGITHDYGNGPVISDIDFTVAPGQVHALLGMNGAGKSTLVHIATGRLKPTQGVVTLAGQKLPLGARNAERAGIVLLSQEVDRALVPSATVHENLTAPSLIADRHAFFSPRKNRARARAQLEQYDLAIDVDLDVAALSIFEKQALSLIRAAQSAPKFLVLDEPTSAFDTAETERFYGIVRQLQHAGTGIIFITHRLDEVFEIADEITVLRLGHVVLSGSTNEVTKDEVVEAIAGDALEVRTRSANSHSRAEQPAFVAEHIAIGHTENADGAAAKSSLAVQPGEVLAIFGPIGSGKTRLARQLFGLGHPYQATVNGQVRQIRSSYAAVQAGIALVPEERRRQGVWLNESIATHFALGFRGIIHHRRERQHAMTVTATYDVQPPDIARNVGQLSGGNQQKVAIGKWSVGDIEGSTEPVVLILDEPMKGIDVAAKEGIYRRIEDATTRGLAVILLTQEPDDAMRLADRIIVLGRHGIIFERQANDVSPADLFAEVPSEVVDETTSNGLSHPRKEQA